MTMLKCFLLLFMMFSMGEGRDKRSISLTFNALRCPYGWKNFGLQCYKYFSHPTDWIRAERNCQSLGANLASVRNKMEDDFLLNLLSHYPPNTWIGGHDAIQEGHWFWTDGTMLHYTNWCSGEPNNAGYKENCLEIDGTYYKCWNDEPCSKRKPYVCVKKL